MRTVVVYESMWGNTEAVARAIAEGVGEGVVVAAVSEVSRDLADDADLVVLGGPTHAFSMSRPSTRHDAIDQGAKPPGPEIGIREWLQTRPSSDRVRMATFDTRVDKVRHLPGSAARKAARQVRRRHLGRLVEARSFYVTDVDGPLVDGELERARAWGAELARHPSTG